MNDGIIANVSHNKDLGPCTLGRAAGKAAHPDRAKRSGLKGTFSYVALTNPCLCCSLVGDVHQRTASSAKIYTLHYLSL